MGHRPAEALQIASSALGCLHKDSPKQDRAALYRREGFALTDLGRLSEAEKAYRLSLKFKPDHPAVHELAYIARLRKGAKPQPDFVAPLHQP
jgi:Flp pilus assembly protein TadD